MMATRRVWLIIGASSGFGRFLTELVLAEGEIAIATLRTPSDLVGAIETNPDRLPANVVFNNAGYAAVGEVEAVPEEAAQASFDVNLWGALVVSKEAIRVFRDFNPSNAGGHLLDVSPGIGFGGSPILDIYSASKHALEGLTDSLCLEINPAWNIKISIIAPGSFKTRAHTTGAVLFLAPEAYRAEGLPSQAVRDWLKDGTGVCEDTRKAVHSIFRFSKVEAPPMRWAVGKDSVKRVRACVRHAMWLWARRMSLRAAQRISS
ncbi:hypothetical protein MVEN_00586500 [Mycena venus]|uniref:NAD(P)-binding protein n=1 Tax=Mycena venus TaxID=2733690 RepID=A0A8H7D4X0_9AGAR|nr:hypothetical protein MVEN_00586500 [Mycena venus]